MMKKTETFRIYGYTNKTNKNWIEKNSKSFGSKAKFLDALITAARKGNLTIDAPKATKIIAKKKTVSKKATAKKVTKKA